LNAEELGIRNSGHEIRELEDRDQKSEGKVWHPASAFEQLSAFSGTANIQQVANYW